jgi:diguanylate cyclase (GGDEF)-like protein
MASNDQLMFDEDIRSQLQDYGWRHDPVTGLPNRAFFRASIGPFLEKAMADGQEIVLLWIDVLNLRREYSVSGDEGAERLVCNVSDSLRPWVDSNELISRFGDHCFVLALRRNAQIVTRLKLIMRAGARLRPLGSEGKPLIAVGAALFPEQTQSPEELIRFASLAAVAASNARSRTAVLFQTEMNTALLKERAIEKDLHSALSENQLSLVYQPQVDLATGNIIGAESLARWNHPTRGTIYPTQFIPVAERSTLIDEVFVHLLRRLLADAAKWRAEGLELPSIAFNASAANVRQEEFVAIVAEELRANPLGATQLEIEVTESLLMDDEDLFLDRLNGLRSIGVKVSLDDFGTRYTGFNALKGLPLTAMKIDKCFVHGINRSTQAQSLCKTIVTMARHLNLSTVAEGIESAEELRILKKMGCDAGQGFLFQRALRPDQMERFLDGWPERKIQPEFFNTFTEQDSEMMHEIQPLIGVA